MHGGALKRGKVLVNNGNNDDGGRKVRATVEKYVTRLPSSEMHFFISSHPYFSLANENSTVRHEARKHPSCATN